MVRPAVQVYMLIQHIMPNKKPASLAWWTRNWTTTWIGLRFTLPKMQMRLCNVATIAVLAATLLFNDNGRDINSVHFTFTKCDSQYQLSVLMVRFVW